MKRKNISAIYLLIIVFIIISGCTTSQTIGNYRVDTVKDGFFNLICFPHIELFYFDKASEKYEFLGSCGAPGIIVKDFKMPVVPSCYAINKNGDAIVYYHDSMRCGGGNKSKKKRSGVYIHSLKKGDKLLYDNKSVDQTWSNEPLEANSIRVTWSSTSPSREGALCLQTLVLDANGNEKVEGKHNPQNDAICEISK